MIITYKNNDEVTERYYKNYYEYLHFSAEENKRLDEITDYILEKYRASQSVTE